MEPDDAERALALLIAQVQCAAADGPLRALDAGQRAAFDAALRDGAFTVLHALRRANESVAARRLLQDAREFVPADWERPRLLRSYELEVDQERATSGG